MKTGIKHIKYMLLGLLLAGITLPVFSTPAYAQLTLNDFTACQFIRDLSVDPEIDEEDYSTYIPLVTSIVRCSKDAIEGGTSVVLQALSDVMLPVVATMITFAIVLFGIQLLNGQRQILPTTAGFLIRLTIVGAFSYGLAGFSSHIFSFFDEAISWVTPNNYSPWKEMDIMIGRILGFAPGITLLSGMAGVLGGVLTSSTVGMFLFGLGFMGIMKALFFVLRVMYTYLMSYMTIAFMIAVSPIIIPMAIFRMHEGYVKKWINKIVTVTILPMLLFAFISLFFGIFHAMTDQMFLTLGSNKCYVMSEGMESCNTPSGESAECPRNEQGELDVYAYAGTPSEGIHFCPPDLRPYGKVSTPVASWGIITDPGFVMQLVDASCKDENGVVDTECAKKKRKNHRPFMSSNMSPNLRYAAESVPINVVGMHFGPNHVSIVQELSYIFVMFYLFSSLMMSLIGLLIHVANDIGKGKVNFAISGSRIESVVMGIMGNNPQKMAQMKNSVVDAAGKVQSASGMLSKTFKEAQNKTLKPKR